MEFPTADSTQHRIIEPGELIPQAWLRLQPLEHFFVFNPAVIRYQNRLLMVYRVDFGRTTQRRVAAAACTLDERLRVTPGSAVALSDAITAGGANHFDPRFLIFRDRLFVHYNYIM